MIGGHQAWLVMSLALYTEMDDIGPGIPLFPLESIHNQMMSRVACHHRHYFAHTVGQRRVWQARVSLRQHTWLDDIERGMP